MKDHLRRLGAVLPLALIAGSLAGCGNFAPPGTQPGDDPYEVIYVAAYGSVDPASRRQIPLPASAHKPRWFWNRVTVTPDTFPPGDPIHSALRVRISIPPGSARETVVVTFADTTRLPRLPRLPAGVSHQLTRTDLAGDELLKAARDTILNREATKVPTYFDDSTRLKNRYDADMLDHYWVTRSMRVVVRRDSIPSLARDSEVIDLRLDRGNPPPQPNPVDDIIQARDAINSDIYLALGLGYSWTALLDTGVRSSHCQLCSKSGTQIVSRLCKIADCTTGDCDQGKVQAYVGCNTFTSCTGPNTDVDPIGHGTSSAAIMTGDGVFGQRFHGVTQVSLDCFGIYRTDNNAYYDPMKKALQLAQARRNQLIVIQAQEDSGGVFYLDADKAYDDGAMVIAAVGNEPSWAAADPGKGRKVLAIGSYKVQDRAMEVHAHGVIRGRVKPDLLAPTHSEAAGNTGDYSSHNFSGTSGATPYAAAAALLLHDWITLGQSDVDPGQVYAHMILSGNAVGPFSATTPYGAGRLRLPRVGQSFSGKTAVNDEFPGVEIPVDITTSDIDTLEAAIWWPEETILVGTSEVNTHNDINLEVIEPGWLGTKRASSSGPDGVYERAVVGSSTPLQTGTWRLRIEAKTFRNGPQTVYWAVRLKKRSDPY